MLVVKNVENLSMKDGRLVHSLIEDQLPSHVHSQATYSALVVGQHSHSYYDLGYHQAHQHTVKEL